MKTWFTSDQHWFHGNILRFTDKNENLIRPGFDSLEHMNEYMINKWNSVVSSEDKVYHLGDIIMRDNRKYFDQVMPRLNGTKVIIKGNHDLAKLDVYADYFKDVRSEVHMKTHEGDMVIFTHRPIFLGEHHFEGKSVWNVHGHIHQNILEDQRYINICVEHWDYTPITWDKIQEIIKERK